MDIQLDLWLTYRFAMQPDSQANGYILFLIAKIMLPLKICSNSKKYKLYDDYCPVSYEIVYLFINVPVLETII